MTLSAPTPVTASRVGIVFSAGKKHVRGHVYVDSDDEWPAWQAAIAADPNLSLVFVPMSAHLAGHDVFHQAVATAVGIPTVAQMFADPRCVVIDQVSNMVEQVILADDSIDSLPGKRLVNHARAEVGHSYDPARKQFTAPPRTLPAKPGVRASAVVTPAATFS